MSKGEREEERGGSITSSIVKFECVLCSGKNFIKTNTNLGSCISLQVAPPLVAPLCCGISISSLVNLPTANWPLLQIGSWQLPVAG